MSAPKTEIFVSTDVETAYLPDKKLIGTFSANLETLPDAISHPKTMAWWKTQPDAWQSCRNDLQQPEIALQNYLEWLKALPGSPVFVAYPAAFDFLFVYWRALQNY